MSKIKIYIYITELSVIDFTFEKRTGRTALWKCNGVVTRRLTMAAEKKTESEDCGGGGAEDCLGSAEVR